MAVAYRCVRCNYNGADGDAHAREANHPRCVVCSRSLQLIEAQVCAMCCAHTRADLADIEQLFGLLPEELGRISAGGLEPVGSSDDQPLPGGDVLAMLAPGSSGRSQIRGVRVAGGRFDSAHGLDEWAGDPQSVAWELSRWEDDVRRVRGERAAAVTASVHEARVYLNARLTWAAGNYVEFAEMAGELRRLRAKLARVTNTHDTPERGVHCLDCEATLLRHWTDTGLADEWVCPRCRRKYTHSEHNMAARQHADDSHTPDDQMLTISEIRARVDIGPNVVHVWQQRGQIDASGKDPAGRNLYRWGSVRKLLDMRRRV